MAELCAHELGRDMGHYFSNLMLVRNSVLCLVLSMTNVLARSHAFGRLEVSSQAAFSGCNDFVH